MNTKQIAVLSGTALIAALLLWVVFRCGSSSEEAGKGVRQAAPVERIASRKGEEPPVSDAGGAVTEEDGGQRVPVRARAMNGDDAKSRPGSASQDREAAAGLREKKLEEWDSLVDRVAVMEAVTLETGTELKSRLNGLDADDRLPAVSDALNLVPDSNFAVFVPLLFDKGQPEEILEAIFNDMLNREEHIKVPLMKELRKDKTHPMFFESARILDATGVD